MVMVRRKMLSMLGLFLWFGFSSLIFPKPVLATDDINVKLGAKFDEVMRLFDTGVFGDARTAAQALLKECQTNSHANPAFHVGALYLLGEIEDMYDDRQLALEYFNQASTALRSHGAEMATVKLEVKRRTADVLFHVGRRKEAIALWLSGYEKELGSGYTREDIARDFRSGAQAAVRNHQFRQARMLIGRALGFYGGDDPKKDAGIHPALQLAGEIHFHLRDFVSAKEYYVRALSARSEVLGREHLDTLRSRADFGATLLHLGDLPAARVEIERAAEPLLRNPQQYGPQLAELSHLYGLLELREGKVNAARKYFENARMIFQSVEVDAVRHARLLLDISRLKALEGDLRAARTTLDDAMGLLQPDLKRVADNLEPVQVEVIEGVLDASVLAASQHEREFASHLMSIGTKLAQRHLGPSHIVAARGYIIGSHLFRDAGLLDDAMDLATVSRSIITHSPGVNTIDFADATTAVGRVAMAQRHYDEAMAAFSDALVIRKDLLGAFKAETAASYVDLALATFAGGKSSESQRLLELALEGIERYRAGGLEESRVRHLIALLALIEGNYKKALKHLDRANVIDDNLLAQRLSGGTEAQNRGFAASIERDGQTRIALSLLYRNQESARVAIESVLNRKGRVLEAAINLSEIARRSLGADTRERFDELEQVRRRIAKLTMNPPPSLTDSAREQLLIEAQKEAYVLEQELAGLSPAFATANERATLEALSDSLDSDTTFVEFVAYTPSFSLIENQGAKFRPRYVAFVVDDDEKVSVIELADVERIDSAVREFKTALDSRRGASGVKAVASFEKVKARAQALDALIFEPLVSAFDGKVKLIIGPDGELAQVPFEALIDPSGRLRLEKYTLTYVTSGRELIRNSRPGPNARQGPVALGGVDFDIPEGTSGAVPQVASVTTRSADRAMAEMRWTALPGTVGEVEQLLQINQFSKATALLGTAASESSLRSLKGPKILHLATHGFFLPTVRDKEQELGRVSEALSENPLLRSGLVLAGANRRSDSDGDRDGILSALEASALDLVGTQLVVMSACETGVGEVRRGDGVIGLRRAMAVAGARTQIMSLWKVDDDATSAMMIAYYQRLARGEGRSEALRSVRLAMLSGLETPSELADFKWKGGQALPQGRGDGWTHPYFWASFLVSGDPRPLPQ